MIQSSTSTSSELIRKFQLYGVNIFFLDLKLALEQACLFVCFSFFGNFLSPYWYTNTCFIYVFIICCAH